jgi:hypothetical protein
LRSVLTGGPGRTLATISEARSTGARGGVEWQWSLWSAEGDALGTFTTPAGVKAAFDPTGERLVVLLADRVELRDRQGALVGSPISGAYHKVALSDGARVLVLGEDADRRAVAVVSAGRLRRILADRPVHGVDVAPDGRSGWIWFEAGVVQALDMGRGRLGRSLAPSFDSGEASVTSFSAEDGGTAVVAFATRPRGSSAYNGARVARVAEGRLLWSAAFPTAQPSAFLPAALATRSSIVAWNRERIAVLEAPTGRGRRPR